MNGNSRVLLGIDVGSSGVKGSAIDEQGKILAHDSCEYETIYPRSGWAEQDPEDWVTAAQDVIRACMKEGSFTPDEVEAIAFVGPAHNAALLDRNDRIIRPTIHWSDIRSYQESDDLSKLAGDRVFALSGQPVNPSWTLSQLLWLLHNEPGTWRKIQKLLVTKDYVRHRFTGDYLTDPFDAVGTQLYDLAHGRWSDELCALIELNPDRLPQVRLPNSIAGTLSTSAAKKVGLPSGIPIAVGSADSAVEAFGAGALNAGDAIVKLGTSSCVNVVTQQLCPSRKTLTYPYLFGNLGFTVAVTTNGTATLKWLRSKVLSESGLGFSEIIDLAAGAPPGCNGLIFHPYLMGERTPYWDPRLRGAFVGLSPHHGIPELARAVLEGVAFSLRTCLETVREMSLPVFNLSLLGGGSKSTLWCQIVSDVLQTELILPRVRDASVGAALLAGVAVEMFPGCSCAKINDTRSDHNIRPDVEKADMYDAYYRVFRQSGVDFAPHFHALHELSARYRPT